MTVPELDKYKADENHDRFNAEKEDNPKEGSDPAKVPASENEKDLPKGSEGQGAVRETGSWQPATWK